MRDLLDLVVQLILRRLAPASRWPFRLRDHWFWLDGFRDGLIAGAVAALVCIAIARLILCLLKRG